MRNKTTSSVFYCLSPELSGIGDVPIERLEASTAKARAKVLAAHDEARLQFAADRARGRDLTAREAIEIAAPWMFVRAVDEYRNKTGERWLMPVLKSIHMTIVPRELVVRLGDDIASKHLDHGALRSVQLASHLYGTAGIDPPFVGPEWLARKLGVERRDYQRAARYARFSRRGMMTSRGWRQCWDIALPGSIRDLATDFVILPRRMLGLPLMPMDYWTMAWLSMRADDVLARQIIWADKRETIDKRSNLTARRATLRPSDLQFPRETARRNYWSESLERLSDHWLIASTPRGLKIR